MTKALEIIKDVLVVIGLLWIALSILLGMSDEIKGRQKQREGL